MPPWTVCAEKRTDLVRLIGSTSKRFRRPILGSSLPRGERNVSDTSSVSGDPTHNLTTNSRHITPTGAGNAFAIYKFRRARSGTEGKAPETKARGERNVSGTSSVSGDPTHNLTTNSRHPPPTGAGNAFAIYKFRRARRGTGGKAPETKARGERNVSGTSSVSGDPTHNLTTNSRHPPPTGAGNAFAIYKFQRARRGTGGKAPETKSGTRPVRGGKLPRFVVYRLRATSCEVLTQIHPDISRDDGRRLRIANCRLQQHRQMIVG